MPKSISELEEFYRLYAKVDQELARLRTEREGMQAAVTTVLDQLQLWPSINAWREQRKHMTPEKVSGNWQEAVIQALYGPLPKPGFLREKESL